MPIKLQLTHTHSCYNFLIKQAHFRVLFCAFNYTVYNCLTPLVDSLKHRYNGLLLLLVTGRALDELLRS